MMEGCILAGGRSSRMGVPKAEMVLDGRSLLRRAVETMRQVSSRVIIALSPGQAVTEGFDESVRLIEDRPGEDGELRAAILGLRTALSSSRAEHVAVLAVDLPNVTAELLNYLAHVMDDHEAAVPQQTDGRLQPLCAVYRREPCLIAVRSAIDRGDFSLHRAIARLEIRRVLPGELAAQGIAENALANLNTPDDVNSLQTLV